MTLIAAAGAAPRLWPWIEPPISRPLLPPWPWQQPVLPPPSAPAPIKLLTPGWRATSLGNPAASRYPACWQSLPRTPWDLALFDGRLYVGMGNSSNERPSANAGPVPLMAYGLESQRWQQEATLPEEEISRFVVAGQQLWIPGADARGSWRWGNIYQRHQPSQLWWQHRRLPRFIHAHDLAVHQGHLVVAGNVSDAINTGPKAERHGSALAVLATGGQSWTVQRLAGWRATALLPFPNALLAVEALPGPGLKRWLQRGGRWPRWTAVHQWQEGKGWTPRPEITAAQLLAGVKGAKERLGWIESITPSGKGVAWIASVGAWAKEQPQRVAVVGELLANGTLRTHALTLEPDEQAMDWQADGEDWWLLSSKQVPGAAWRSRINRVRFAEDSLQRPDQLLAFQAPLPAWSLAGKAGEWFVGMGHLPLEGEGEQKSCSSSSAFSGTILRLTRT